MNSLKGRLISNGFSNNLSIEKLTLFPYLKAWWNGYPRAKVTIKKFVLGQDSYGAGGYVALNDPYSPVVYTGLSYQNSSAYQPIWKYVNASMHELGHGIFGFEHDENGYTNDPNGIMDYRSVHKKKGANFSKDEQIK